MDPEGRGGGVPGAPMGSRVLARGGTPVPPDEHFVNIEFQGKIVRFSARLEKPPAKTCLFFGVTRYLARLPEIEHCLM